MAPGAPAGRRRKGRGRHSGEAGAWAGRFGQDRRDGLGDTLSGLAPIRQAAPAKLNLYFHLLGRRPDGYHEVDSLVAFADVHDRVVLAPGKRLSLQIDGPFAAALSTGPDNLAHRAAHRLAALIGRSPDMTILLSKQLPVAAGIGGGSADAAAVLRGLSKLWQLAADQPECKEVARELGADVPVCLAGRAARVGGVGERIEAFATLPECGLVLANPGVPLQTPRVFAARSGAFSTRADFAHWPEAPGELAALLRRARNDLTEAAIALVPEIADVLGALDALPGCLLARMSGSGATCFGLFDNPEQGRKAAAQLAAARPAWWVRAGRLVSSVDAVTPE